MAAFMIIMALLIYFVTAAKSFLIPIVFGLLLSFLLHPMRNRIKKVVKYEGLAIALAIIALIIPVGIVVTFFSVQLTDIISSLPSITKSLEIGLNKALSFVVDRFPFLAEQQEQLISNGIGKFVSAPLNFIQTSFVTTTTTLFNLALTFLYTIFFLYYFKSFKNFLLYQVNDEKRPALENILLSIKSLTQKYLTGIGLVVIILSFLNSIGLAIIGIKYPIFWGCLAGLLAIIPYIGTTLGGTLPFLFALATAGNFWQPIAVVIYYATIQQIEGNIITPKIVGDQVDINPLVALVAIIVFGSLWGVAGIVLSLPLIAMIRIILEHVDATKPLAILLGSDIYNEQNLFKDRYNKDKYRLSSLFQSDDQKKKIKKEIKIKKEEG